MDEIIKVINESNKIEPAYKEKIIYAISLIVSKYPQSKTNLLRNLSFVTIKDKDSIDEILLKKINAKSCFISHTDTLVLDNEMMNDKYYLCLLVHELLHISSYNKEKKDLGFEDGKSHYGVSINEGMTEYLTRSILGNMQFGMLDYNTDINNMVLMSGIIDFDYITNSYFNGGLSQLYTKFNNQNYDSFYLLMYQMDLDFTKRIWKKDIKENTDINYLFTYMKIYYKYMDETIKTTNKYDNNTFLKQRLDYINEVIKQTLINNPNATLLQRYQDMSSVLIYTNNLKNNSSVKR